MNTYVSAAEAKILKNRLIFVLLFRVPVCGYGIADRAVLKKKVAGTVVVTKTGFGHYHTGAAIDEFGVGQLHVNHSVASDVTETYHRGSGNHVKNKLCGSAGLHAGASGNEFGPNDCDNRNLGSQGKRRVRIAGDTGGEKTILAGGRHSTDHIRGSSRGGYADNRVLTCRGKGLNVLPTLLRIVLGTFAPSDQESMILPVRKCASM